MAQIVLMCHQESTHLLRSAMIKAHAAKAIGPGGPWPFHFVAPMGRSYLRPAQFIPTRR